MVAFSWNGLPQFAARLIRAAIERLREDCVVVGSRPSVPVRGMEDVLKQKIHWVDADTPTSWQELGLDVPEVFVQSGWSYPAFSALGREVKRHNGIVIGLSDATWRGDFRQLVLGPLGFRLLHRHHFDAMLVAGRRGQRLLGYFGLPPDRVRIGMLGADATIFQAGPALAKRPKRFLFVGRYQSVKNVVELTRAFVRFAESRPDWTLHMCGSGELRDRLIRSDQIVVEDFVHPEQLAARFHQARFLVLPSVAEPWGVVVHEAALCGCALLLSNAVGSTADLATARNAVCFKAGRESDLLRALHRAADLDETWLAAAGVESRALAAQFGPERFAAEVVSLIAALRRDRQAVRTESSPGSTSTNV